MICYKDMTFCATDQNDCCNQDCSRYLSPAVKIAADGLGLPLALADFSGRCEHYIPHPKEET